MTKPPSPNERSVRISRTTLYRSVAGIAPGREFAEKVLPKPVQARQVQMSPEIMVGVASPQSVASPLRHIRPEAPQNPAIAPVEHPGHLCALEVLPPASQIAVQSGHHRPETLPPRPAGEPPYLLPKTLQRLRTD